MPLPTFLRSLIPSARPNRNRPAVPSRRRPSPTLTLERLEDRLAPVVGAGALAPPVPPGQTFFDGVVKIVSSNGELCTGSLLFTGHHVITAAHCIDNDGDRNADAASYTVTFEMPGRDITHMVVPGEDINIPVSWDGTAGNGSDIAVFHLPAVAPYPADRYPLYRGRDEVGQTFLLVSYGLTGIGNTGNQVDEVQRVTINNPVAGGTFSLTYWTTPTTGETVFGIPQNATAQQVASFLEALPAIGPGDVHVSTRGLPPNTWDVRFVNRLSARNVIQMTGAATGGAGVVVATNFDGNPALSGVKRSGWNQYDGTEARRGALSFDFDNGLAANNALGGTGLGADEASTAPGDSGGGGFLFNNASNKWELASVNSFIRTNTRTDINDYVDSVGVRHPDSSFGEIAVATRVSSFAGEIDKLLDRTYDVVLDMGQQTLGLNARADDITITARRNGPNLELVVSATPDGANAPDPNLLGVYYSDRADRVRTLIISGWNDDETIVIEGDLGVKTIVVDGDLGGHDRLILDHERVGDGTYTLTKQGPPGPAERFLLIHQDQGVTIEYDDFEELELWTGRGRDTINVQATDPQAATTIDAGGGRDLIILGDANNRGLDQIQVAVRGGEGSEDVLRINNQGWPGAETFTITDRTVHIASHNRVVATYDTIESLQINAGSGDDTFEVKSLPAETIALLRTGTGTNTVTVGDDGSLARVRGGVFLLGDGPNDRLTIDNRNAPGRAQYTLDTNSLTTPGVGRISFFTVETVELHAGGGPDLIGVRGTATGANTTVFAGDGHDEILVGNARNRLDGIHVTVDGQGGDDTVSIDNTGWNGAETHTITATTYSIASHGRIVTHANVENLELRAGGGPDDVYIPGTPTGRTEVRTGGGADLVRVESHGGRLILDGQAGNDRFRFTDYTGRAEIDGGPGSDTIQIAGGTHAVTQFPFTSVETVEITDTGTLLADTDFSTGAVQVREGKLNLRGGTPTVSRGVVLEEDGILLGTGTIDGDLLNQGQVWPGGETVVGRITVRGRYDQTAGGKLNLDLRGPAPGTESDNLDVHRQVRLLRGALNLNALPGFNGDTFELITNQGRDPVFRLFAGLPEGAVVEVGGRKFRITYRGGDGNDVVLITLPDGRPMANDDRFGLREDGQLVVPAADGLLENDEDADGDPLTARLKEGPAHGTLVLNADGSFTYTPDADFHGLDTFAYAAHDGRNESVPATVTLTVREVNDPPIPGDDTRTIDEDTPLIFPATELLANDRPGPANEAGQTLTVIAVGGAVNGTVSLADGTITFTPTPDFHGTARFTYTLRDNGTTDGVADPRTATGIVTVTVNDVLEETSTTVVSSNPASVFGEWVTFTATVSAASGTPTGSVQFRVDGVDLGPAVPLTGNTASLSTNGLAVGGHLVTAAYSGDAVFASSAGSLVQAVDRAATRIGVLSQFNPTVFGQANTIGIAFGVIPPGAGTPTGAVTLYDTFNGQTTALWSVELFAPLPPLQPFAVGVHELVAVYTGDGNFRGSTSAPLFQVVNPADTTIEVESSNPVVTEGEPITFTAAVSVVPPGGGVLTGTVTFLDTFEGTTRVLGTVPLGGSAPLLPLEVGTHEIVAVYSGDGNFNGSTSDPIIQVVLPGGAGSGFGPRGSRPASGGQKSWDRSSGQQVDLLFASFDDTLGASLVRALGEELFTEDGGRKGSRRV